MNSSLFYSFRLDVASRGSKSSLSSHVVAGASEAIRSRYRCVQDWRQCAEVSLDVELVVSHKTSMTFYFRLAPRFLVAPVFPFTELIGSSPASLRLSMSVSILGLQTDEKKAFDDDRPVGGILFKPGPSVDV